MNGYGKYYDAILIAKSGYTFMVQSGSQYWLTDPYKTEDNQSYDEKTALQMIKLRALW